jgi:hypothetical protein
MTYEKSLEIAAHWAAILTSVVAVWAYGRYVYDRREKRIRLEKYLEAETAAGTDQGQRTVMHLVARLGMTESEIVDAAFRSRHVSRAVGVDDRGRADTLLFVFKP